MQSRKQNSTIYLFLKIAFSMLLPCFLIFLGIDSHFKIKQENSKFIAQQELEEKLEILINYSNEKVYFHNFFKKIFANANNSQNHTKSLIQLKSFLRKVFKNKLKLIIWNSKGQIDTKLSDEKRFKYVLKTAFKFFSSLKDNFSKPNPSSINNIKTVKTKLPLLRGYFGKFLSLKILPDPLKTNRSGKAIVSSIKEDKYFLWFQVFKNFSVAIFLDKSFSKQNFGKKNIVKNFNNQPHKIKLGFVNLENLQTFTGNNSSQTSSELQICAQNYLQNAQPTQESKNFVASFRQVSPTTICFSYIPKKLLINFNELRNQWLFSLGKLIFISLFLGYVYFLVGQKQTLSIRFKIFGLFFLASILPLLILVSIAFEYFQYKEYMLINQVQNNSVRKLKELDRSFPGWTDEIALNINQFIKKKEKKHNSLPWSKNSISEFAKFIKVFSPDESSLINKQNQTLYYFNIGDLYNSGQAYRSLLNKILIALNSTKTVKLKYSQTNLKGFASERDLLFGLLNELGQIRIRTLGAGLRWSYINILGDRESYNAWAIIFATWQEKSLQIAYIKDFLSKHDNSSNSEILLAKSHTKDLTPNLKINSHINQLMEKTFSNKFNFKPKVSFNNKNYIFTSIACENLDSAVFGCLSPKAPIDQAILSLKRRGAILFILLIIISCLTIWSFSGFLIQPINQLELGIKKIANYDFNFQLQQSGNDEFGDLIATLNSAIIGLEDLKVASLIQESLLPTPYFQANNLEITGKSKFMSKMGGDYFDYFHPNDAETVIVFGDVAGHGIPAALVMSMVKAVIYNNDESFISPSDLIAKTNEIFLHLKKQKWRRMMTFQCFQINRQNGNYKFANAGHCYPVLIDKDKNFSHIKQIGMPLGSSKRNNYKEISGKLASGHIIILYSDGFIESKDRTGKQLGTQSFENILKASYSTNIETFHENIFKELLARTGEQDDDLSLLIIKYEGESDNE